MKSNEEAQSDQQSEGSNLAKRYGKIGISAVVAALPYLSQVKKPPYAPAIPDRRGRR